MRYWKCVNVEEGDERAFTLNKIYTTDDYGYNLTDDTRYVFNNMNVTEIFSEFEEVVSPTQITFSTIESILDREYPNGWQIV